MRIVLIAILFVVVFSSACVKNLSLPEQVQRQRSAEALLNKSVFLMRRGELEDLDHAESALFLAKELLPRDARIHDGLGCVYWRKGDFRRAEKYFKEAKRIDPFYHRAYVHLALLMNRRGENKKAREYLEYALQLSPLDYRARNNLAVEMLEGGSAKVRSVAEKELLKARQGLSVLKGGAKSKKSKGYISEESRVIENNLSKLRFRSGM